MSRHGRVLHASAPAKLNVFLKVHNRRPDGYHAITTVMTTINLYDTLTFTPGQHGIRITCNRRDVPTDATNTAYRAAEAFLSRLKTKSHGVRIHIQKRIPMQAGLGGGSSDAAATLLALNRLHDRPFTLAQLARMAAQIGSDVPFFLHAPAAICTGRGERVRPLAAWPRLNLVLVVPRKGNATAKVYRRFRKQRGNASSPTRLIRAIRTKCLDQAGTLLHNDLETAAASLNPSMRRTMDVMRRMPFAGVLMTGSGSAVFGLCRNRSEAGRYARTLGSEHIGEVLVVHTL